MFLQATLCRRGAKAILRVNLCLGRLSPLALNQPSEVSRPQTCRACLCESALANSFPERKYIALVDINFNYVSGGSAKPMMTLNQEYNLSHSVIKETSANIKNPLEIDIILNLFILAT